MSVTVNSTILERRDTTEYWEYVNPVLADREQGYEVDSYGTPVGMKMGDGVTAWVDLPYWFSNSYIPVAPEKIFIGKGATMPYNIDMSTRGQYKQLPQLLVLINKYNDDGTQDFNVLTPILAPPFYNYANSSYATLNSIDIYGNPDGSGNFNEDTYVLIINTGYDALA